MEWDEETQDDYDQWFWEKCLAEQAEKEGKNG